MEAVVTSTRERTRDELETSSHGSVSALSGSHDHEIDDALNALTEHAVEVVLSAEERAHVIGGRYQVVEKLGAGGMGQVVLVRHQRLGKRFALKLMHAEWASFPEAEETFHREAQLASHLSHPNIVEVVDFGYDPDWGWFIVMEYLPGRDTRTADQETRPPASRGRLPCGHAAGGRPQAQP
jgi:serine/threonine protein kinase